MDPVWLCGFGRSESSEKSADTSQTQAVGKSSMKSGTKGFTGLKGISFTLSEPRCCVCVCVCGGSRYCTCSLFNSLIAERLVGFKLRVNFFVLVFMTFTFLFLCLNVLKVF